jgi:dUTPase
MSEDYALLKLYINPEQHPLSDTPMDDQDEWRELYNIHVDAHNCHIRENLHHANSGFDVFFPHTLFVSSVESACSTMIPLNIHAKMYTCSNTGCVTPTAYYLMPRSSISKTPLMLANQMGLIDRGYRGTLIAAVRNLLPNQKMYAVEKHTRLFQLVHPSALPILVEIVSTMEEFSEEMTARGDGGFGSTGQGVALTNASP